MIPQLMRPGTTVETEQYQRPCTVMRVLGAGGQGEVYQAMLDDRPVALKWYFPHQATPEQREALATLIRKGEPNSTFLWPIDLAVAPALAPEIQGFGYVMPLREERFVGIVDIMSRDVEPSFYCLTTACFNLVQSFQRLHSQGLCYRDISFGNVFFDPDSGEIAICDNDNVALEGESEGLVLGTPRFMAPEVIRHEQPPSTQTDLYSLAVLLFYIFVMHHPLEGKREADVQYLDPAASQKLHGESPVFIFDPADDSNRPVRGYQDNAIELWKILPRFLKDLFIRSFTDGIRDPANGRVREAVWLQCINRLRDCVVYCASCGVENFCDTDAMQQSSDAENICWSCQRALRYPAQLWLGSEVVMLTEDRQLFPHHVDLQRLYDFSTPVAEVSQRPDDPDVWGLKNLSTSTWMVRPSGKPERPLKPGKTIRLANGTRIRFGSVDGEVRA